MRTSVTNRDVRIRSTPIGDTSLQIVNPGFLFVELFNRSRYDACSPRRYDWSQGSFTLKTTLLQFTKSRGASGRGSSLRSVGFMKIFRVHDSLGLSQHEVGNGNHSTTSYIHTDMSFVVALNTHAGSQRNNPECTTGTTNARKSLETPYERKKRFAQKEPI